jgi:hypothetical protein
MKIYKEIKDPSQRLIQQICPSTTRIFENFLFVDLKIFDGLFLLE